MGGRVRPWPRLAPLLPPPHLAAGLAYDTWPQGWHTTPGRRVGIRHLAAGLAYDTWPQGRHTTPGPGLAYDTRPRVGIRHPAQGWHTTPGPGLAYTWPPGWHTPRRRVGYSLHFASSLFSTLSEFAILYILQLFISLYKQYVCTTPPGAGAGAGGPMGAPKSPCLCVSKNP